MDLTRAELAAFIDHTLLKTEATDEDVAKLAAEAVELGTFSICVSPNMLPVQAELGAVKLAVVCGFPSGKHTAEIKAAEARAAVAAGADAWTQGMLTVIEWRLADFVSELRRYRPGVLRCADAVADLRLSGAFRVDDTDTLLENLGASLPVKVRYLTRYWVSIEAV